MTVYRAICTECDKRGFTRKDDAPKFPSYEARAVWCLEHHRATGHERIFLLQEYDVPEMVH